MKLTCLRKGELLFAASCMLHIPESCGKNWKILNWFLHLQSLIKFVRASSLMAKPMVLRNSRENDHYYQFFYLSGHALVYSWDATKSFFSFSMLQTHYQSVTSNPKFNQIDEEKSSPSPSKKCFKKNHHHYHQKKVLTNLVCFLFHKFLVSSF